MKGASYLLVEEPFHWSFESSSSVLVESPWGACHLLVSTDFPNTVLPVSRKPPGASHSARAGMCQLLPKEAILTFIPLQGIGRAGLFPTARSTCAELHMTLKGWGSWLREAFLGLEIGFKTMQGDAWMLRRVLGFGHARTWVRQLFVSALLLWDRGTLSPWDPAERRHMLYSLPLGLGSVSSAVVPDPFVLK